VQNKAKRKRVFPTKIIRKLIGKEKKKYIEYKIQRKDKKSDNWKKKKKLIK
jgi:hypothetical protein